MWNGGGGSSATVGCTLDNYCDTLLPNNMAQKRAKATPIYSIMNLVLHSNSDIYMFYLLIYLQYIQGLTVWVKKNRNRSIFSVFWLYWVWLLASDDRDTRCWSVRDHMKWTTTRGRDLAKVDKRKRWKCQNFVDVFYGWPIRYNTRCYFNVRSKADISQLNLPHGTDN